MPKYLLDANLSPETAKYLRKYDISVISIQEDGLGKLTDEEIVVLAKKKEKLDKSLIVLDESGYRVER